MHQSEISNSSQLPKNWQQCLNRLHWRQLKLIYQVEKAGELPRHKGSAWRGMFGHVLKDKAPDLYNRLFDSTVSLSHPYARRYRDAPRPYLVFVPNWHTRFEQGDTFTVSFILIGWAADYFPRLLMLLQEMGGLGLGPKKVPIRLKNIHVEMLQSMPEILDDPLKLHIKFRSPLILKGLSIDRGDDMSSISTSSSQSVFPFRYFVQRIAERLNLFSNLYCDEGTYIEDATALTTLAESSRVSHIAIRPCFVRRDSMRSGNMQMKGVIGSIRLAEVPAALFPILHTGSFLHLGKGAAWGMGKYQLELLE